MKHCAARPDADALWLCQPTPVSTMPKTMMPCQVSWQFVAIKLQPSMHALGAEAAVAAEAPVGTASAAHASTPQECTTGCEEHCSQSAELCHASLPGSICPIMTCYKVGRQHRIGAICSDARKFRSEWQPRHKSIARFDFTC